jgi:hypothetical protein
MRLLIDENVAQAVADTFTRAGHDVLLARDVLAVSAPDQLVAISAAIAGRIIVTHDKDFKRFANLLPPGFQTPGKMYGRIHLSLREDLAAGRVDELMLLIESTYTYVTANRRRLQLRITETRFDLIDNAPGP